MNDQLSGGNPFAPQPKSFGAMAGDYLHKARVWMDEHTPGLGMAASFMGGPGSAMGPASTMGQGGILNDPETLKRMQGYVKQASPIGGDANSPKALFGPPTFPGTVAPRPEGFVQPGAAPEAPQASGSAAPAPALPAPIQVGAGRIGMPMAPQVSDGGYNSIDAQARTPVVAKGGSYDLGARMKSAGGHIAGDGGFGFTARNTAMMRDPATGDFLDPQAAKRAEANGPDLIKKFMNYLNDK